MIPSIEQIRLADSGYQELRKFLANNEYVKYVIDKTDFLENAVIKQRFFHILNDIFETQKCCCGLAVKWNTKNNSYRTYCSSKCAHNSSAVKIKTQNTCIEKYGVKTNLLTQEAKIHYSKKMVDRFGVDNPFKSKEKQQEFKEIIFNKYGVENISKLESTKEKINQTHINRYGRIRKSQSHISQESYLLKCDKQALSSLYVPGTSIKDIADKLKVGHSQLCLQFKKFGIEIHQSVGQRQVYDFIKTIYSGNVFLNDRKALDGKEIDIYMPDLNLGIEYDGIFWHCQESANKIRYHKEKDLTAKSKGIKLIHIIDLEWQQKQNLVKSRLSSLLNASTVVYARKTQVKIIDKSLSRQFFEENHIQGNTAASFSAGLFFDNKLIAAMSFGLSRYNDYQFELLRFCSQQGLTVVGGASKLFKFSVENLKASEVVSFSDLRWGTGKVYEQLGFQHIRDNDPSYIYTFEYKTLESRVKYQKHKLEKILSVFDQDKSEWENMKINGFDRYWNSGNSVYVWTKPLDQITDIRHNRHTATFLPQEN